MLGATKPLPACRSAIGLLHGVHRNPLKRSICLFVALQSWGKVPRLVFVRSVGHATHNPGRRAALRPPRKKKSSFHRVLHTCTRSHLAGLKPPGIVVKTHDFVRWQPLTRFGNRAELFTRESPLLETLLTPTGARRQLFSRRKQDPTTLYPTLSRKPWKEEAKKRIKILGAHMLVPPFTALSTKNRRLSSRLSSTYERFIDHDVGGACANPPPPTAPPSYGHQERF